MAMNLLAKARAYEEEYGRLISDLERPSYHISPTVGWLNDPNGFSYYDGKYHLFYQYNPYSTQWDTMHWGHLVSEDLLHWKRLPAALAPDQEYDCAGVFSGSGLMAPDGRHLLMYTGVQIVDRPDGGREDRQVQCLAFGDGTDYVKYENNPVITPEMLPEGGSTVDFRDPKIFRDEEEGCYYAVVGSCTREEGGNVALFRSRDIFHWEFVSILDRSEQRYGYMWECPDYFRIDDTDIILISPMKLSAEGLEFHCGNNAAYLTGNYDREKHTFERKGIFSLDYGIDFYAPQTMTAPDGRRIMIAWMQTPETRHSQPAGIKWFGQLTVPRELTVKEGRLLQRPIRELEACRRGRVFYRDVLLNGHAGLAGLKGRCVDMTLRVRPAGRSLYRLFSVRIAADDRHYTSISYRPGDSMLSFDRSFSGLNHYIVSDRDVHVGYREGEIKIRILIDRFSVEAFVNDGEQALTFTIYTPQEADGIFFETDGAALLDVEKYDMVL